MRLEQATQMMALKRIPKSDCACGEIKAAKDVARRVFEISAQVGDPYEGRSEDWAKKWLASKRFTLVAIAPYQVAVPFVNRIDRNKVLRTINAASRTGDIEPIVVDVNKNKIGKTQSGYVPHVIVLDGKHRHKAQLQMGKDRVLAWVGELALAALQQRQKAQKKFVIDASAVKAISERKFKSNLESAAILYAAMPGGSIARQDSGDGGQHGTGGTQVRAKANGHPRDCDCAECSKMEAMGGGMGGPAGSASTSGGSGPTPPMRGLNSQGARSSGSLSEESPSDRKVPPDPSDRGTFPDPSDRLDWRPDDPQMAAPGGKNGASYGNSYRQSPGSGVGPGLGKDYGAAKNSERKRDTMNVRARGQAVEAGPVRIKKMWTRDKKRKMDAVAPPGREKQVLDLKKKFGEKSDIPYKIAWSQENK